MKIKEPNILDSIESLKKLTNILLQNKAKRNALEIESTEPYINIDDATEAKFSITDNHMYITGDGVISGVQMTLQHDLDFAITMTDRAYLADYLTEGNQTRLLVIYPETDALFRTKVPLYLSLTST